MKKETQKKERTDYYSRNRARILKKRKEYLNRPGVRERQLKYLHEYYQINRKSLLEKKKEYLQRPEVVVNRNSEESKEKRRKNNQRYRESIHGKKKRTEYDKLYRRMINPDYWKKRYLNKREEIRAKQREYEATPDAKAKKRAYERRPDRRLIKAKYTMDYQARSDVREKRNATSRAFKRSPRGLQKAQFYNEIRRGRLRGALGSFTEEEWLAKRNATNGRCPFCESQVGVEKMTIDHILPLSKGGSNSISNIRALCRNCNSGRGNRGYSYFMDKKTGKTLKVYG